MSHHSIDGFECCNGNKRQADNCTAMAAIRAASSSLTDSKREAKVLSKECVADMSRDWCSNCDVVPWRLTHREAEELCDSHEALRDEVERLRNEALRWDGALAANDKEDKVTRDVLRAVTAERDQLKNLVESQRAAFDDMRESYAQQVEEMGEKLRVMSNEKIDLQKQADLASAAVSAEIAAQGQIKRLCYDLRDLGKAMARAQAALHRLDRCYCSPGIIHSSHEAHCQEAHEILRAYFTSSQDQETEGKS